MTKRKSEQERKEERFTCVLTHLLLVTIFMKLIIHTDGGARGNPGPAAVGVVIETENGKRKNENGSSNESIEFGKRIGETTNNVAEYTAVIEALKVVSRQIHGIVKTEILQIDFYLDSLLVVQQLNGVFKIKDMRLRELSVKIRMLEGEVGGEIQYHHVRREENTRADYLVNQALDER